MTASLALLGPRVDRGRVPYFGRPRPEGSGFWATIVRAVMRRPVVMVVVSAAAMLALASPI
jgi:RND superfamily putative drug exporter